jgi:hypothetical protein
MQEHQYLAHSQSSMEQEENESKCSFFFCERERDRALLADLTAVRIVSTYSHSVLRSTGALCYDLTEERYRTETNV